MQIQVPFLQKELKDFKLVPIVVGQLDSKTAQKIGKFLSSIVDDNTLVIASSDFTHYGPRFGFVPFSNNFQTSDMLKKLDMNAVKNIEELNFNGFLNYGINSEYYYLR